MYIMSNTTVCVFRERERESEKGGLRGKGRGREDRQEGEKGERWRETMGLAKTEARKPASLSRAL